MLRKVQYFQTKNKLSQTSEEQRQLLYSQIEKLRNSYQRANKSVYHHIANQNANLFVKFVYGYIPANAEQLDHLRVIARGFNSAHVEELVLAGDSTPQTLCYLAAWHWGMGEGFRRIKEYPKSLEPLKKALEFAESGFGPVDSITLSIRKDMVMSLHFADKHDEAKSVLNTGDQYCRAAIAADPSLLSNTNPDQITSWWGKLLALAVMLPPESDGAPFEEKLWKNRIEICKQIPRSDHEVFVPTYEHGFSDFFQLFMKEDRPEDVERVLRRQLAVSLPVTDLGPRNWNDRESATLALAIHLCKSPQGQFQETETLLNSVYPRLIALLNKDVRVDLTNRKYLMEHKDINLGDCIRAYIDMYDRWDKPNESMKWKREYAEYNKKLRETYPKMVIPK